MRKILLLLLVVVVVLWAADRAILTIKPAGEVDQNSSRKDRLELMINEDNPWLRTMNFGSKHIDDANYIISYVPSQYYYFPREARDTFAVRFVSPAKCSLVAFRWSGFNDYASAASLADIFVADTSANSDNMNIPPRNDPTYGWSRPFGATLWDSTLPPPYGGEWDTVNFANIAVDTFTNTFFIGMTATGENVADTVDNWGAPAITYTGRADVHSYLWNDNYFAADSGAWYGMWNDQTGVKYEFGFEAYIMAIEDLPPKVQIEALPYTYSTDVRKVYVYGYDFTPAGSNIDSLHLHYSVNGGAETVLKSPVHVDGTLSEGIWSFDIPAASSGDTVTYFAIGYDPPDPNVLPETTTVNTYVILQGNPGHFLYVDNGYTISSALPDHYDEGLAGEPSIIDVWDFGTYGAPDSSVFAFYSTGNDTQKTVIWRDWGCVAIGVDAGYGLGGYDGQFTAVDLVHCDSTWIKQHLDAGGYFWLSDQDQGFGLGICPNYGRQDVPAGSWIQQYLGIQGMWDDPDSLAGRSVKPLDGGNSILSDLFSGNVGYQSTMGEIYIAPYTPITGGLSYAYTASFDSLDPNAILNMYYLDGGFNTYIISYALTLPSGGKVYNDGWPFDFICNPADSTEIDEVAVDTLVQDVLDWFNVRSGISDETLDPEKMVRLLPMGLVTGDATIRFSLPKAMVVSLDIYDNTGRLVKNLVNGEVDAGLHVARWNSKVAGVYFYRLTAGDKTLTDKMVVIK